MNSTSGNNKAALRFAMKVVKAFFVSVLTVGLVVLLGVFVFRPLLPDTEVKVDVGQVDSIERPKYWGEGPVVGPAFTPRDPTYPMSPGGLGFDFRVPATWGCRRFEPDKPGDVKWVCIDEAEPNTTNPSGVVVARPCGGPICDLQQYWQWLERQERAGEFPAPVRKPNPTTMYYEYTRKQDGRPHYHLTMLHFYHRENDERFDTAVIVAFTAPSERKAAFTAPPERKAEIQKIVNDIREATS